MRAVFMCAISKLRRKWVSHFLLGICILITTVLFVNALILLRELNAIFDRAYEELDGPQMCCLWSKETVPPDDVRQYLDSWQGEMIFQITENTKTVDYMEKDGIKLSNGILLELPETVDRNMISPKILEGETPEAPGRDEIWVTTKMANILGLEKGDCIALQLAGQSVQVKVAQIVVDPVFGSSSTNVYRMWCGYAQLSHFPLAENHAVSYLEVRFRQYDSRTEQHFIRDAEKRFHMPLGDTMYTYDRIKSGYTAPWQMVSAALCSVSFVLAVTVIVLMLFLVHSDRDEDIRNIGIYKTLGMTGAQITGVYLVSYGMTGFAGASLGSVLGGRWSRGIVEKVLGDMGLYDVSFKGIGAYQLFAGILVPSVILATCFCSVFKVRRLNAAHAVRTGSWQTGRSRRKEARGIYNHGKTSFVFYYAVRGMQNKKRMYGYIAGVSLILGCLAMVCLGCLNAVRDIDREPEIWGFIKTDIYVTSQEDTPVSGIIKELESEPQIIYTYGVNKITAQYKPDNKERWQSIAAEVYELPWKEDIKDRSLYGRRPLHENEVAIGLALAREYGLEVGGRIELIVNGKKAFYEITGIFQTLSNYGKIIRMVTKDLDVFMGAEGVYADYMLVLAGNSDKWEYAKKLAARYGGKFSFIVSKSNGENITGILAPAVGTIITALLFVTILITMNLTFLLIQRERKQIGLLKAVGMTSWQIVKIYALRNGLSALVGSSLGLVSGIFLIPKLLTPCVRSLGLSEFPFVNSLAGTAVGLLLLPACMVLGTYAVTKTIAGVSVKNLVSD